MTSFTDTKYIHKYRERSFILGKEILVIKGNKKVPALAIDIDNQARLLVEYEDKTREYLSSGEASIKPGKDSK